MINFRKIGSRFRLDDDSYSPQSSNEIKYREGESNCSRASPPPSLLFSNHGKVGTSISTPAREPFSPATSFTLICHRRLTPLLSS